MTDSTTTAASARARVPEITRREFAALANALRALDAIEARNRSRAYGARELDGARNHTRLEERADCASDAIDNLLICAEVYLGLERAKSALSRGHDR